VSAQSHPGVISDLERLRRELDEVVEQQAATSQVLEVIGQPSCELGSVFDTVVHHAVRLCRADSGMIWKPSCIIALTWIGLWLTAFGF
jgi:hypothetical protein